ncbi:hypothetical protein AB0J82_39230 [Asanoa sp. NPDC049518]|uniref:hypothetical protein n=1 Tax=unclassified Asanoa TaxID=2685164 RepID=UPI0034271711
MRVQPRLHLATVGLVAVIAASGCAQAGPVLAGDAMTAPAPAGSTAAPTLPRLSARPVPDQAPTVIPVSAFLALPDGMRFGDIRRRADADNAVPRLCGGELASRGRTAASAAVFSVYQDADAPSVAIRGVLYQTIRTYPGNGAAGFMRGLRADLASCDAFSRDGVRFRVRTAALDGAGDEALTVDVIQPQLDLPGNPVGGEQTNRAVVVRIGDTVTILWDEAYERSSTDPDIFADFTRRAVDTIHAWRR